MTQRTLERNSTQKQNSVALMLKNMQVPKLRTRSFFHGSGRAYKAAKDTLSASIAEGQKCHCASGNMEKLQKLTTRNSAVAATLWAQLA